MTPSPHSGPGTRPRISLDEGIIAAFSCRERVGRGVRKGWLAAILPLALAMAPASTAVAQSSIEVSAQVISLDPINQGLAEVARLAVIPAVGWWRPGVRTETRLAVVTRDLPFSRFGPTGPAVAEPTTITIMFLRN